MSSAMETDLLLTGKKRRATLTKNPPPAALSSRPSLRKPQSSNSLQRTPSAPYPRSQSASQSARDIHRRSRSNQYDSSTSSLIDPNSAEASPITTSAEKFSVNAYTLPTPLPPNGSHNDLIGAPFDASGILSSIQSSTTNGSTPVPPRPQPPPLVHTHTSPDLRLHQLKTPQPIPPGGQPMMENTPPRSENGTLSPKRFSGEAQTFKPSGLRKKSGFSSFVNSMLGSPRTIKISAPENPMHMIHVGFDNETGQFTVSNENSQLRPCAANDVLGSSTRLAAYAV